MSLAFGGMNFLANLMTSLSLAFGFISIVFSLESHFTYASWGIILAVIFDGLDGQIARLNPVPSNFGKELDSLVDVVSFGIAPSILGYIFIYHDFYLLAILALFVYLFCSVMRLAKYNVTPKEDLANCFIGLPTTVSGGVIASFILIYRKKQDMMLPKFIPHILLPNFIPIIFIFVVLLLSLLMVSRIRYLNLDGLRQFLTKETRLVLPLVIIFLVCAPLFRKSGLVVFSLFLIYLLFSPLVVKRLDIKPR